MGVRNTTARGSGFVIDWKSSGEEPSPSERDIYLLTAAHVALPGYRIQVVFYPNPHDNEECTKLSALVVGRDIQSDLALLKVSTDSEFTPPSP
jgi:S1-C subfamily serine protease